MPRKNQLTGSSPVGSTSRGGAPAAFRALALLVGCALTGCGNLYTSNFVATPDLAALSGKLAPYSGRTQTIASEHLRADLERLIAQGYAIIGTSKFETQVDEFKGDPAAIGRLVGADIVIWKSRFDHTEDRTEELSLLIRRGVGLRSMDLGSRAVRFTFDHYHAIYLRKTGWAANAGSMGKGIP